MLFGAFLKTKKNATSYPNIGLLKTAIEEEWNKMSEEFILESCKPFQRHFDTIIEKMVAILSKFTVLCLFDYFVYFLKLKLILFYYKAIYYYTRRFLILLLPSVHNLKFKIT